MIVSNCNKKRKKREKKRNDLGEVSHRLCGRGDGGPLRDAQRLMSKKDKDLEDEQCMMENHRCYGEGKALAV